MEIKGLLKGHLVKHPNWLPITKTSHDISNWMEFKFFERKIISIWIDCWTRLTQQFIFFVTDLATLVLSLKHSPQHAQLHNLDGQKIGLQYHHLHE